MRTPGSDNPIIDAAFARAKVAMLVLVVLAFMGVTTYFNAPREADPDIPLPFAQVILSLPGVSPEDAERLLIRPAEAELQSLEGLVEMNATAFESVSLIRLEFEVGLDMDQVIGEVREAVDRAKADFPVETHEPVVEEFNAQQLFPVITVILSGDAPERALTNVARELETRLTALPDVLEVNVAGARDETVDIIISPEVLENYGLTADEIALTIRQNNALIPAGALNFTDGSFAVKVPGLFKSLSDIAGIPIRTSGNDTITLGDIAEIRRTFDDAEGYAQFDGAPAIGLNISKRSDANLIETTQSVIAEAEAMVASLPSTINISYVGNQSVLVDSIFTSLTSAIALAIILVMIVVVAALGLRPALLVGIAIPSSFLIGLALIGFLGFTMNNLVMFSMVLSVGMLVDGAIVIVELADRRMAEGAGRREAFKDAAKRMFWPVTTSTATTLAAFLPFLFWGSIEGYFMRWIPITLILVLSASLTVALIFLPIIGSFFGIPARIRTKFNLRRQVDGRERPDLDNIDPTLLTGFTGRYARVIDRLARMPVMVIILGLLTVMACSKIFALSNVEVEQFIRVDSETVLVLVQGRGNISADESLSAGREVLDRIREHPAIESAYLQTGPDVSRSSDAPPETIAQINLDLYPYQDRDHSLIVIEELRELTSSVPGLIVEVRQPEQGPQVGKDIQLEFSSPNVDDALAAAALARSFLDNATTVVGGVTVPAYQDVEDNRPLPGVEWKLVPDRAEAGRYGLTIGNVGNAVQLVTGGLIVDTYRPDDVSEELDIRLRFPVENRSLDQLGRINLVTPAGPVPLSNFVDQTPSQQLDRIVRRDGRRYYDVKASGYKGLSGHEVSQDRATQLVQEWLDTGIITDEIGPGVQWRLRGAAEDTEQSSAFLQSAMLAAMAMIGAILLLQFNSFYHAVLTLSAVVLSVFGVLLGIALSGQYISVIMTGVGIVALAGIVVNNNIVLIDTFQSLRRQGLDIHDAAVRTAAQRLRPVLLTTITTIIGLLPMMFEIDINFAQAQVGIGNETSAWWVLLSSAIVYGLAFSTILTLIITPVLLAMPTVIEQRVRKLIGRVQERRTIGGRTIPSLPFTRKTDDTARTAAE